MANIDDFVSLPSTSRCKRCGRTLTDHVSILNEMGPVCRIKSGLKIAKPRVEKVDLAIRKPKVHSFKFERTEDTVPAFDLEGWFSDREEDVP